jgi:xanthine/uracil permease
LLLFGLQHVLVMYAGSAVCYTGYGRNASWM